MISTIPVLRKGLMSFFIFKITHVIFVNAKELPECGLSKNTLWMLHAVIGQQAAKKHISRVTTYHSSHRPVVEIGIVRNTMLPSTSCLTCQQVHRNHAVRICAIMYLAKQCHVHCPGISSD